MTSAKEMADAVSAIEKIQAAVENRDPLVTLTRYEWVAADLGYFSAMYFAKHFGAVGCILGHDIVSGSVHIHLYYVDDFASRLSFPAEDLADDDPRVKKIQRDF